MAAGRRIRVLIVDDSVVMRSLLRTVVSADAGLEVAATAADGEAALRTIASGAFDLILLDVEMPVMDGLATLRQLRIRGYKMPVIMCSSLTQRGGRVTIEALAGGASDYVAKPSGQGGREAAIQALSQELIPKIHALTQSPTAPAQPPHIFSGLGPGPGSGFGSGPGSTLPPGMGSGPPPGLASGLAPGLAPVLPPGFGPGSVLARAPQLLPAPQFPSLTLSPRQPFSVSAPTVLVIGVSTGGPAALDVILPSLPAGFPLPVLIVQHMPEVFTRLLAERLNGRCRLRAKEAADGDAVRPGTIFIARGNWHMEVLAASRLGACASLRLNQNAPENHCRPSVDPLFRSAAAVYGAGVLAVVLTGMGSDGLQGCRAVREQGGAVFAQDQASSTVWGMPGAVVQAGLAHKVLPLHAVVAEILRSASAAQREVRELRESAG